MVQMAEYFFNLIGERMTLRDYSKLPADFERDAVRMLFQRQMKDHFRKDEIRQRIQASKAETFAELRKAITS